MAVLSCLKYQTIPTTCIEYGHPWTDSCRDASLGLLIHAFKYSLRTYTTLYLDHTVLLIDRKAQGTARPTTLSNVLRDAFGVMSFTSILRRKKPSKTVILQTLIAILQSTAFLTTHAYGFSACLCTLRRLTGRFDVLSTSFTPAFFSSLVAIHLERPSRRPILCLYVTNIASETLFRMAVARGWVKPIKHGEIIIFALSMTSLLYRFRGNHSDDSMFSILRFVLGKDEERVYVAPIESSTSTAVGASSTSSSSSTSTVRARHSSPFTFPLLLQALRVYRRIVTLLKSQAKASCCPHNDSCLFYTLKGGLKMLSCGYGLQVALRAVLSVRKMYKNPSLFPKLFYTNKVLNLGAFLGLFTTTFRGTSCALRWIFGYDSKDHSIPAGLLAGLAFWFYPDTTIALYVMWKSLQMLYTDLVQSKYIPEIPGALELFYSFSVAVIFHAALYEPHHLRPAYGKFLGAITEGRFVIMNRQVLATYLKSAPKNIAQVIQSLKLDPNPKYTFEFFGTLKPGFK